MKQNFDHLVVQSLHAAMGIEFFTLKVMAVAYTDVQRRSVKTVVICATGFILRSSTIFMYSTFQGSVKVASANTEYFMLS